MDGVPLIFKHAVAEGHLCGEGRSETGSGPRAPGFVHSRPLRFGAPGQPRLLASPGPRRKVCESRCTHPTCSAQAGSEVQGGGFGEGQQSHLLVQEKPQTAQHRAGVSHGM